MNAQNVLLTASAADVHAIGSRQYAALLCHVKMPSPRELFDFMVEMLVAKGIAKYGDADPFRKMVLPKGLFGWIPPCPEGLGPGEIMTMVGENGGQNNLDPQWLADVIPVPDGPYIMSKVMDGSKCLGLPPGTHTQWLAEKDRFPLTWYEGAIHVLLFYPFIHHNLMLGASRYERGAVPCINMTDGAKPYLYASGLDFANSAWGTPSCYRRFTSA
jgi:hypothetical protein